MKKLAVLLLVCMLMLCAAAQAEYDYVIDLENENTDEGYFDRYNDCFEFAGSGQILITGKTEYPVVIHCDQGEITLRDVYIDSDNVGLWIDAAMPADLDSAYAPDTIVLNLEGDNVVRSSSAQAPAVSSKLPLEIRGNGQLSIEAKNSFAGLAINEGSLTVTGGHVKIYCRSRNGCAYLNGSAADEGFVYGKVNTGSGYVILAGKDPESAKLTDANRGEAYLEITNDYDPDLPETGDGANLVMWTVLLAVSTLGVLAMSRKARKEY